MKLPTTDALTYCRAFIYRELDNYRKSGIWPSYWPVMTRILARADELKRPFDELVGAFGYTDKQEDDRLWLTLEHFWFSTDYARGEIVRIRQDAKELRALSDEIIDLATRLAEALARQEELYATSGFERAAYQTTLDLVALASVGNYLHEQYVADELQVLRRKYELKYWPTRIEMIEAVANFERGQPEPTHEYLPEQVMHGRASDIKDYVLAFDATFDGPNSLPNGFRLGNHALADVANVVLNLPPDQLTDGDAVGLIRRRYCPGQQQR